MEMIRPVKFIEAKVNGNKEEREFSGVTQASDESVLSFKVQGIL